MNILIDNRYCNRFIYLGRPIFFVNRSGASVYNPHDIWKRACAYQSGYSRKAPLTQSATQVRSSLLDSLMLWLFREPILSPIIIFTSSPTCFAGTNAIAIGLISTSATSDNPPFLLVVIRWLRIDDFSISCAPECMSHKTFITVYFYIWTWYKPILAWMHGTLWNDIFMSLFGKEIDVVDTQHFNNDVDFVYR